MGNSKAARQRKKLVRQGRLNPEINRSPFALLDLRTKKTKTKKDRLYKDKHKNRYPRISDSDSFLLIAQTA